MPRHIESIGETKFWAYYYMVWSLKETEEQKLHYNLVLLGVFGKQLYLWQMCEYF